jgi:hypothetical protein
MVNENGGKKENINERTEESGKTEFKKVKKEGTPT